MTHSIQKPKNVKAVQSVSIDDGCFSFSVLVVEDGEEVNRVFEVRDEFCEPYGSYLLQEFYGGRVSEILPQEPLIDRRRVALQAELRIEKGSKINGIQFRCDDKSLRRLNALLRGFERGAVKPEGVTYETQAGDLITFKTKAEVEFMLNAAEDFESAMLERSAQLQQLDPIPDPTQSVHWDLTKTLDEILAVDQA